MTDQEFKSLRAGDRVCVDGRQISYDALVLGPCLSSGDVPVQIVEVHRKADDVDYVYKAYRAGYRTTEQNRPSMRRGWLYS